MKQVLTSEPVLKLYRRDREHVLQTEVGHEQIAATLLQREDDEELHPVMYASRKLLPREVRYAIPDKLCSGHNVMEVYLVGFEGNESVKDQN